MCHVAIHIVAALAEFVDRTPYDARPALSAAPAEAKNYPRTSTL